MSLLKRALSADPTKALTIVDRELVSGVIDDELFMPFPSFSPTNRANEETVGNDFESYASMLYKRNGVVFACSAARSLPFTEARFQFQEVVEGRPGRLMGGAGLSLLESPWPGGTTGELLARMEQDITLAGNFYAVAIGTGANRRIRRLRPDWVTIVSGVRGEDGDHLAWHHEAEVLGYIYAPPKRYKLAATLFEASKVAHYSPYPDPVAQWRGMSWLSPVIEEITADTSMTKHKRKFFENGAMPSFAIKYDSTVSPAAFQAFVQNFNDSHRGADNAYKVLHLGGGADPVTVGSNLQQLDFKATQGAAETRIAAAAGVGSIIARLSEGMQGSSLNQGNYHAAKRQFADMTLRPLWRGASAALSNLVPVPPGARLWTDVRDVAFLAEDSRDEAEILSSNAQTVRQLIDAGYSADAAVEAVQAGDLNRLTGQHTGLFSVQLQSPSAVSDTDDVAASTARQLSVAEVVQKIYLGVGKVVTVDEARQIVNDAGGQLSAGDPFPVPPSGGTNAQVTD